MLEGDDILGKIVRVVLCDRRVIEGMLLCMDRHLNLAIGDAIVSAAFADAADADDKSYILIYLYITIYHRNTMIYLRIVVRTDL
jgi:small nuclear ribonucleoprotein (snRNP)-like protein